MVNVWIALLACTLAAFIGYCWGRDVTYRRVARNVVRLQELVPSAGLRRRAAGALHYAAEGRGIDGNIVPLLFRRLEELAARIEAAGAGAESVPPAWTSTHVEGSPIIAAPSQCTTCLFYVLPSGDDWCYMFKEPPEVEGVCKQWKGGGE